MSFLTDRCRMTERVHMLEHTPPTASQIDALPYVELLALMGESNLPPGGFAGVRGLITSCQLRAGLRVLHVGSSGGFLSRELARLTGCSVLGIDISPNMVSAARRRAGVEGLEDVCKYQIADARTFVAERRFDVALTGGALAFVDGQAEAVASMVGTVKPYGFVALCELSYHARIESALRQRVSGIIGVPVPEYSMHHWSDLLDRADLVPWEYTVAPARVPSQREVKTYCRRMASWASAGWSPEATDALERRLNACFSVFAENLEYMSSVLAVARYVPAFHEPLLFV